MIRSGKVLLVVGALLAWAGNARAADPLPNTQSTQQPQLSYTPAAPQPAAAEEGKAKHFVKPSGYDQNPWNYPYTRSGAGPKPN